MRNLVNAAFAGLLCPFAAFWSVGAFCGSDVTANETFSLAGEWRTKLSAKDLTVPNAEAGRPRVIEGFEGAFTWKGNIGKSPENAKEGGFSGRYVMNRLKSDEALPHYAAMTSDVPHDWESYRALTLWLYCPPEAAGAEIDFGAMSDYEDTPESDYYRWTVKVDWAGWRSLTLDFDKATPVRRPAGWDKVDAVKIWIGQRPGNPTYKLLKDGDLAIHLDQLALIPKDSITLKRDFVESEGVVGGWQLPAFDDSKWDKIKLPAQRKDAGLRWYRREFTLPASFKGRRTVLRFEALTYVSWIWINGTPLKGRYEVDGKYKDASCQALYAGCEFDITDHVRQGVGNKVAIMLHWPDGIEFVRRNKGGVLGDVELLSRAPAHLHRTLVSSDLADSSLNVRTLLKNTLATPVKGAVDYRISRWKEGGDERKGSACEFEIPAGSERELTFKVKCGDGMIPWSPDRPQLYNLDLSLRCDAGVESADRVRFGFREFAADGRRFRLNGKTLFLRGEGCWMSDTLGDDFFAKLKAMNMNAGRSWSAPSLRNVYDKADETGFLVIDEAGGTPEIDWGRHGDVKEFHRNYLREMPRRIHANYNHPSIVMWSMGNEMWRTPIPTLNRKYELAKSLDPTRPVLGSGGGPNYRAGGMAESDYKDYKTDVNDVHCYHGWYEKPILFMEDWIDLAGRTLEGSTRPLINTESVGRYPTYWRPYKPADWEFQTGPWPRWLGEGCLSMSSKADSRRLFEITARKQSEATKISIEMWRMRKGDTAGAFVWDNLVSLRSDSVFAGYRQVLKDAFAPILVCARLYDRNCFAGSSLKFPICVINDTHERLDGVKVELQVSDCGRKSLLERTYDFGSVEEDGIRRLPASFDIGDWPEGAYAVNLVLRKGETRVSENSYPLFVARGDFMGKACETAKKVLLLDSEGTAAKALADMKVGFERRDGIGQDADLSPFDVLIAGSGFKGDIAKGVVEAWAKKGGRVLCLDQSRRTAQVLRNLLPASFDFIYTWGEEKDLLHGQFNSFVDVRMPAHPAFKGLSPAQFEDWNGNYHVLTEGFFEINNKQMESYALAKVRSEGHWNGSSRPGVAMLGFAFGKGEYVVSQLQAAGRYGGDPVASKFLRNLLEYVLTGERRTAEYSEFKSIGVGPFKPDQGSGFIRHFLVCGPFPNPGGRPFQPQAVALKNNGAGLDRDCFKGEGPCAHVEKGEEDIEPVEGMKHGTLFPSTKEGYWGISADAPVECVWTALESQEDSFRLSGRFNFAENVIAYAACYVKAPADMDVKMKIGSDDGNKVWLNHKLVGGVNTFRGVVPDSEVYPVKLRKGVNSVLLKIAQDIGGTGFCLRFTDMADKPLTGLDIWLAPERGR